MPFGLSLFSFIKFPFGVYIFKSDNARTLHTLLGFFSKSVYRALIEGSYFVMQVQPDKARTTTSKVGLTIHVIKDRTG